jgi:hypothetical protein
MFWNKLRENLLSVKVWAGVAILLVVRFTPGLNEAQADVLKTLLVSVYGANVSIDAIKAVAEWQRAKGGGAE